MNKTTIIVLAIVGVIVLVGMGVDAEFAIGIAVIALYNLLKGKGDDDGYSESRQEQRRNYSGSASGSNSSKGTYRRYSREDEYKEYILELLAVVMNANGEQKMCELERVKSTITRYWKSLDEQKEAFYRFKTHLKESHDIDKVCDKISGAFSKSSCEAIVMELLAVAFADGDYEPEEQRIIKRVCNNFGISTSEYNSILAIFKFRKKAGYYGDTQTKEDNSSSSSSSSSSSDQQQGYYYRDRDGRKRWRSTSSSNGNNSSDSGSSGYRGSSYSGSSSGGYRGTTSELDQAYKTLQLSPNCTDDEVRSAKKKLLRKWHPDLYESQGAEAVRNATENSKVINQAYETVRRYRGMSN